MPIDELCAQCQLYLKGAQTPNIPPYGATNPWLYVVGMAPGKTEDAEGKPFVGDSGQVLKAALKRVGCDLRHVRWHNVVNCWPPGNKPTPQHIRICSQRVKDDIRRLKPRAVLVLGNEAITGMWHSIKTPAITRLRGAETPLPLNDKRTEFTTAVVTYHPSYIIRGVESQIEDEWLEDLALAWEYASTPRNELTVTDDMRISGYYDNPRERITLRRWSELREFFARLVDQEFVAWDWETTDLVPIPRKFADQPITPQLYSGAWAFNDVVYVLKLYEIWNKKHHNMILEAIARWMMETPKQTKIAHNLKFELIWTIMTCMQHLFGESYSPEKIIRELAGRQEYFDDTMLMSWLWDGREKTSRLKHAGWAYLGFEDWSHEVNVKNIVANETKKVLRYNQDDAWNTLQLRRWAMDRVMVVPELEQVYRCVTRPAAFAFADVEMRGTPIDNELRVELADGYNKELKAIEEDIRYETGLPGLNPGSPDQLSKYFAEDCGYQMLKKTKKGWSTDEDSMKHLIEVYQDPVAELVLEIRGTSKLNGTYVDGLSGKIFIDDRLHASYNLAGPVTGRTSSSDPNMQNFPKRKKEQKIVRRMIVPPPGYKLASFDYGQIEARLFGVITGDPIFCRELHEGLDIHLSNAIELFGQEEGPDHRGPVKNGTFAMFYGAGDPKISNTVDASIEKVAALRQLIFGKYTCIKPWQSKIQHFYAENGYVESLFGRRRRAPMSFAEILNQTNQSTASDMTLVAMNTLWWAQNVALMIHDDLSFFIRDDEKLPETLFEIATTMLAVPWWFIEGSPFTLEWVPLTVECELGDNWHDLKPMFTLSSMDMHMHNMDDCLNESERIFDRLEIPEVCTQTNWRN